MTVAELLPLAFVMIAGPQIVSAFFFATSERWAANSAAYVGGAAISVTAVTTVAYLIGKGASGSGGEGGGSGRHIIDWVVLVLLLGLVVHVFLTRHTSEPPKWMSRLQGAAPRFALGLGAALLGVFPTDIISATSAGLQVARHGHPWWQVLPFVALTLLLLALPALAIALGGKRARSVLPKIRDWMNRNAWVISEAVLVFFVALTINSIATG